MQNFKEQTPGGVLKHYFEFKTHMSAFCTFNDIIFTSLKKLPLKKNTTINNYHISGHIKCVCYKWNRSWPKDKLKYYLLCLGKSRSVTICHHFSNVFSLTQYCQLWLCPKSPPPPPLPLQLNWCVCLFVFVFCSIQPSRSSANCCRCSHNCCWDSNSGVYLYIQNHGRRGTARWISTDQYWKSR